MTYETKRWHIRLTTHVCTRITNEKMSLIRKACEYTGMSLSEFCKLAALKEARLVLLEYRSDKLEVAKDILRKEKERRAKE